MKYYIGFLFVFIVTQLQAQSLLDAARENDISIAKKILKNGAEVNQTDSTGQSALAYAVLNENVKLVKQLLKHKAKVDAVVLVAAAQANNEKISKQLHRQSINWNAKNSNGDTPLLHALKQNDQQLLSYILENNADVSITDAEGNTPFLYAILNQNSLKVIRQLQTDKVLNKANNQGKTPLLAAMATANTPLINELLANPAVDLNVQTATGLTPLWYAIESNQNDLVQNFISRGTNIEAERNGNTPLMYAIQQDNQLLADLLLNAGANPFQDNKEGISPVIYHLEQGNYTQMQALIERKPKDINRPNRFDYTILDYAFRAAPSSVTDQLIAQGAKFGPAQQRDRMTPLMLAIETNKVELIDQSIDRKTINTENRFGHTALTLAIRSGNLSLVKKLVNNGAKINQQNQLGNVPIGYAIAENHVEIVRYLLEQGASIDLANKYGSTPIIEAAYFNRPEIARLLLQAGANKHFHSNLGDNAIEIARRLKNQEVLRVLQ